MDPGTALAVVNTSAKVLSIFSKYYSEVKDAQRHITNLVNEIEDFRRVMQKFYELLRTSTKLSVSAALEPTIVQTLSDLGTLQTKLNPKPGARPMKRLGKRALTWPFEKKEVEEWTAKLHKLNMKINVALSTDQSELPFTLIRWCEKSVN